MIIAVEKKDGFFKIDCDNIVTQTVIDQGNARRFQGKEMFWVESDGSHSRNISNELAAEAIAFFAAQEKEA